MKQYKIVQIEPQKFKAYYKGRFFWHCYQAYSFFGSCDEWFYSLKDAEDFLSAQKILDKHELERKQFKKVTRLYPPLKLPGDCD